MTDPDIIITGSSGFYQIERGSTVGNVWLRNNVQGYRNGIAYCDSAHYCRDIVDGAKRAGLNIEMNGIILIQETNRQQ